MFCRTPLMEDPLDKAVFLKCEHHLPGGSYKARGLEIFLRRLAPAQRKVRVLSAGNMARTLALLARPRGISVEALVPGGIPEVKRQKLTELGVLLRPLPFAELWEAVDRPSPGLAYPLVHPVDTPELLEGYAAIVTELLKQRPGVSEVVLPIGVGGLTLGVSQALRRLAPQVRVVVAENDATAPFFTAYTNPGAAPLPRVANWIDAIGTPYALDRVKARLFGMRPLVDEIRTVTPEAALLAGKSVLRETGELMEGAAAVALAAARGEIARRAEVSGRVRRVGVSVVVVTGKNVNPAVYCE